MVELEVHPKSPVWQSSEESRTESLSSSRSSELLSWQPSESWSVVELEVQSRSPVEQRSDESVMESLSSSVSSSES